MNPFAIKDIIEKTGEIYVGGGKSKDSMAFMYQW